MEQNNSNDDMGEIIPASRARNVNKYTDISTVSSKYGSFITRLTAVGVIYLDGSGNANSSDLSVSISSKYSAKISYQNITYSGAYAVYFCMIKITYPDGSTTFFSYDWNI